MFVGINRTALAIRFGESPTFDSISDEDYPEKTYHYTVGEIMFNFLTNAQKAFTEAGLSLSVFIGDHPEVFDIDKAVNALDAYHWPDTIWPDVSGRERYFLLDHLVSSLSRSKRVPGVHYHIFLSSHPVQKTYPRSIYTTRYEALRYEIMFTRDEWGYPDPNDRMNPGACLHDSAGNWVGRPIDFRVSYSVCDDGSLFATYTIDQFYELLALDYMYLSLASGAGYIRFCHKCGKVFRTKRWNTLYCSSSCSHNALSHRMTEYKKKYSYRRKYVQRYMLDIRDKCEAGSSQDLLIQQKGRWWRSLCRKELAKIDAHTISMTPEGFADYIREEWDRCRDAAQVPEEFRVNASVPKLHTEGRPGHK